MKRRIVLQGAVDAAADLPTSFADAQPERTRLWRRRLAVTVLTVVDLAGIIEETGVFMENMNSA